MKGTVRWGATFASAVLFAIFIYLTLTGADRDRYLATAVLLVFMADRISSNGFTDIEELSAEPVDLVEITGVVKWFDVAKGFGFIVPDNGMQDVLLHVTCLRRDGYQTILEGTRIVALIQRRERGYQAFKILSMAKV